MEKLTQEEGLPSKVFSAAALDCLVSYSWPGNIRQLENVVERCLGMQPAQVIEAGDLPGELLGAGDAWENHAEREWVKDAVELFPFPIELARIMDGLEAALLRRALVKADFVQARAAESLGISRSLLQYKLRKYNIGH